MATPQRKVINPHHLRRGTDFGLGQIDDQPQQRAAVHRDAQRGGSRIPARPASSSAICDSNPASGTLQRW